MNAVCSTLVQSLRADGMTVLAAIDHLRRHLRRWARPRRVGTGWRFWPARAELRSEPLGVVGVISPWNYPVNLALVPLATAIAAGNHVFLKPSEHTPRSSDFLRALLGDVFPADRVAVATGGAEVAAAFAALPFDHLVFTGSTAIGRKVMARRPRPASPLTLELGGKSPAIVCATRHCRGWPRWPAASGSTPARPAIAPDYVLLVGGRARRDALVEALRRDRRPLRRGRRAGRLQPDHPRRRLARLQAHLDDARARPGGGAAGVLARPGSGCSRRTWCSSPATRPGDGRGASARSCRCAASPRSTRRSTSQPPRAATGAVSLQRRPRQRRADPAQYPGRRGHGQRHLVHFGIDGLPFGGVGASGMGAYHGRAGFDAMSKQLPVAWQARRAGSDLLRPPYARIARLIDLLVR